MINQIEDYIRKNEKLHPIIIEKMQKFFKDFDLHGVKIKLVSPFWGKLSGRGSPTSAFVTGGTVYMMRGAINVPGRIRGNYWDLSTPTGFATLAHEIFHVYQYKRYGFFKSIANFISGFWNSITKSKILYDHKYFKWEREASRFQQRVQFKAMSEDLSMFKDMR